MIVQIDVSEIDMKNIQNELIKYFVKQFDKNQLKKEIVEKVAKTVANDYKVHGAVNAGIGLAKKKIEESVDRKIKDLCNKDIVISLRT